MGWGPPQGWTESIKAALTEHLQERWKEMTLRRGPIAKHNKERSLGKGNEGWASTRKHSPDTRLPFGGVPKDATAILPLVEAAGRAGGHFTPAPIPASVLDTCPAIPVWASRRPKTKKEPNHLAPWHCQGLRIRVELARPCILCFATQSSSNFQVRVPHHRLQVFTRQLHLQALTDLGA